LARIIAPAFQKGWGFLPNGVGEILVLFSFVSVNVKEGR